MWGISTYYYYKDMQFNLELSEYEIWLYLIHVFNLSFINILGLHLANNSPLMDEKLINENRSFRRVFSPSCSLVIFDLKAKSNLKCTENNPS